MAEGTDSLKGKLNIGLGEGLRGSQQVSPPPISLSLFTLKQTELGLLDPGTVPGPQVPRDASPPCTQPSAPLSASARIALKGYIPAGASEQLLTP